MDLSNKDDVISRMRAANASKQYGQEEIICALVAGVTILINYFLCLFHFPDLLFMQCSCSFGLLFQEYIQVCPNNSVNLNVDNVFVA